jgi:asparagine synthase (glutamine-hydrolysing)
MCGICGIIGKTGKNKIRGMNSLMRHRGPDDEGYYFSSDPPVCMGMRRLSIIDLESGSQPIFNEDKTIALVFNGEIYNYKQLRSILIEKGHKFFTKSDTEILVHGYEEYGFELPKHLNGMFAFALWDQRKKTLFCARDRFGMKPFYYYFKNNLFIFASEQKPILHALDYTPEINRRSLLRHLIIGFYTGPYALFKDIKQLSPGNILILQDSRKKIIPYYKLCSNQRNDSVSEEQACEFIREEIGRSVRAHMVSDVPVGLTLSGGLDSSIIAYEMSSEIRRKKLDNIHAYTVGFGHSSDEIPFARSVSNRYNMLSSEFICSPGKAIEDIPSIVWFLEEPLSNITAITAYQWAKLISRDIKTTLVGEGADEIFAGYFHYRAFAGLYGLLPGSLAAKFYRNTFLQPPMQLIIDLLGGGKDIAHEAKMIYHDEFLSQIMAAKKGLQGILMFDLKHELPNNQLLRVDRMSMAHSLEARVPYLDHRLVEMVMALPDRFKIRGKRQKFILKKAFKDIIPPSIIDRPKIGPKGSQPIFPILFRAGLEEKIIQNLTNPRIHALKWFNPKIINDLINKRKGVYPVIGTRIRDKLLYALFMFTIWNGLFIEKKITHHDDIPPLSELI